MSITGTNSLSIRKMDIANSKKGAIGFQQLVAAHQATVGATGFNINSLTAPPDMVAAGFVQPSLSQIAAAKMLFNRKNLKLISSAKGELVDFLSYFVTTNNQIVFNGWTAEDGEIFTIIINNAPISGAQVVDAVALNATGTLLTGTTDFNVGTPYEVGKYINTQMGAVLVFLDGVLQFRNTGNATATPSADGNYQEVNPGGGLGVIIRFNVAPTVDVPVSVISNGLLVNQPTDTQNAVIQNLAGSLDSVIATVAVLAGVPTTNYKSSPSNVDLKQFGDKVVTLETSYPARKVLGDTTGVAVPAGYIGEIIEVTGTQTPTTGAWSVTSPLTLPPGVYIIDFIFAAVNNAAATTTGALLSLSLGSSTAAFEAIDSYSQMQVAVDGVVGRGGAGIVTLYVRIISTTSYYGKSIAYTAAFTSAVPVKMRAVRIA
jgi:hypothetical protein